jgi:transcriptional regulator with XRE-family HTH domain
VNEARSRRTTSEWLQELGTALRSHRVRAELTQEDLARRAGISLGALKHLESGAGANLTSLVRVVRALGLEDWLATLAVPAEPTVSPIQMLRERRRGGRGRQRVRRGS